MKIVNAYGNMDRIKIWEKEKVSEIPYTLSEKSTQENFCKMVLEKDRVPIAQDWCPNREGFAGNLARYKEARTEFFYPITRP